MGPFAINPIPNYRIGSQRGDSHTTFLGVDQDLLWPYTHRNEFINNVIDLQTFDKPRPFLSLRELPVTLGKTQPEKWIDVAGGICSSVPTGSRCRSKMQCEYWFSSLIE